MSAVADQMEVEYLTPRKTRKEKSAFDRLPYDIQEEIECLYEFVPEVEQHFEVIDKIGEGTFSSVFLARLKQFPEVSLFALKHIIPTSHPSRIEGELRCLLEIGGCDNVMGVELCLRNKDHVVIVMQYFPHEKFQDYILTMSCAEVREYLRNLLLALRRVHQFNVIHRDVKPSNFLYDKHSQRYALVDFGLAHKAPTTAAMTTGNSSSHTKISSQALPHLTSTSPGGHDPHLLPSPSTSSASKSRQYTPPTLNINNSVFAKRIKSPRRLLLAKRALLIKEKQEVMSQQKQSGNHLYPPAACQCFQKPQICSLCSARTNQQAHRAGTPGFRSPEVLMKHPDQSTAVDIWSAGVIFLSLLSGRYPFFRANDDMTALAQIISIMGTDAVKEAAKACGKTLICSPSQNRLDFRTLCSKLRTAPVSKSMNTKRTVNSEEVEKSWRHVPDSAYDLLSKLLDLNPYTRISAADALQHPFFTESISVS